MTEDVKDYAIFLIDLDGRVASWNAGAGRTLGYDQSEIVGKECSLLFGDQSAKDAIASFVRTTNPDEMAEFECWCVRKNNSKFWAVVHINKFFDEEGLQKGFSVIIRDLTERKAAEDQLRENEIQLRSLAARLQAVREEERTRIARELHDEFGQMLTALRMDLSILERMVSRTVTEPLSRMSLFEKIGSISELLEKTIRATRRIITELRPAVLDELGLSTAIQWQTLEFENRTGIRCRIAKLQHDIELDQNASTAVFRILQEALNNVAKHAGAKNVTVSLSSAGETVVMDITDDGKGMDEGKQKDPTSTGLLGIRERVLALQGSFEIRSKSGEGTHLTISIPYNPRRRLN